MAAPSGVALLLPLTFGMNPTSGIIMLAALYAGTMYGGTITSVLINTPGESASVVTCLDGHQMALQGRAGPALGIAAIGSFIAGTVGVVLLMLVSPALARWSLWARSRWAIVRGTLLGFAVGTLPGAGPTVATFMSYALEKKISKHPEEFGHGAIEGVAAPESANNAAATGAMVPMLTLGIPGSATTAIMLGGLMMWGLRPGPLLFEKNPEFVWGLIASQYIANVMLLILSTAAIPLFVRALRVPYAVLMPIIIIFCITGAYSLKNSVWDVGQMLVFGVLGYAMKKLGYSPAALVLALVLGPLAERALRQSLIISDAGLGIFFMRPIAAVLTIAALAAVVVPLVGAIRAAARRRAAASQAG